MTIIHIDAADGTSEPLQTCAVEVVERAEAHSSILTGGGVTLVHLKVTVHASVAHQAVAEVGVVSVLAAVRVWGVAWGTEAVVDVYLTESAIEACRTGAGEGAKDILGGGGQIICSKITFWASLLSLL